MFMVPPSDIDAGAHVGSTPPSAYNTSSGRAMAALSSSPYRCVRRLGQSADNGVYLARDERSNESVVVRSLPSHAEHPLAALDLFHPSLAVAHDRGRDDDGLAYVVVEYVPGENLHDFIARHGPVRAGLVEKILGQICSALHALHEAGHVHASLRPSDCIIDFVGESDPYVTMVDLGWRAPRCERLADLRYMSPEQLIDWPVAVACDIYRVGNIVYELMTGRPAQLGDDERELKHQIVAHPTPTPRNDLSGDFRSWFRQAMAKNPFDRFADVQAMYSAFAELCPEVSSATELPVKTPAERQNPAHTGFAQAA